MIIKITRTLLILSAFLVVIGRFSSSVHRAYSLFHVIGTFGATRVPPVGYGPFKSMEQLAPLLGVELSQHLAHAARLLGQPGCQIHDASGARKWLTRVLCKSLTRSVSKTGARFSKMDHGRG